MFRAIHASSTPTPTVTLCARRTVIAFVSESGGPGNLGNGEHTATYSRERRLHPPLLPDVGERPRALDDDADVGLSELFGEEMRLGGTNERDLDRVVDVRFDLRLERNNGCNRVRAFDIHYERNITLFTSIMKGQFSADRF